MPLKRRMGCTASREDGFSLPDLWKMTELEVWMKKGQICEGYVQRIDFPNKGGAGVSKGE